MTKTNNAAQLEQAVHELFGLHPEDVIAPARIAADVFNQLEELFKYIKEEAEKGSPISIIRIKHLAGAGAYLASDFANYTGGQFEDLSEKLNAAGIETGGTK